MKLYRPSNGTEGEIFMEKFCYQCIHDDFNNEKYCEILSDTMIYDINDSEYPKEWHYDKNNKPVCAKFNKR